MFFLDRRNRRARLMRLLGPMLTLAVQVPASAAQPDPIGLQLLRQADPSLDGAGIRVAQVEGGAPYWETNPGAIGLSAERISYFSGDGLADQFPNVLGSESVHANTVGNLFFGLPDGISPNVARVYNYEASFFYQNVVQTGALLPARIINQSFVFPGLSGADQEMIDGAYDYAASEQNTLFVSAVGNSGSPATPATAYNTLGVSTFGGSSGVGPTTDNGRCKPELAAPAGISSLATPIVAGAATILLQAAEREDAGPGTGEAASDMRTLKALLLNGGTKPRVWSNAPAAPLDPRYGAGLVNVYNPCRQLWAGRRVPGQKASAPQSGGPAGWDLNSVTNMPGQDAVRHYSFEIPTNSGGGVTFSATLVWNRQPGQAAINNLDLILHQTDKGRVVLLSTSRVDNVEHVFTPRLAPGPYDLQVVKRGSAGGQVTPAETYALAYAADTLELRVEPVLDGVLVSWPLDRSGFVLETTSNITATGGWTPVDEPVGLINGRQAVRVSAAPGQHFFRLAAPRLE